MFSSLFCNFGSLPTSLRDLACAYLERMRLNISFQPCKVFSSRQKKSKQRHQKHREKGKAGPSDAGIAQHGSARFWGAVLEIKSSSTSGCTLGAASLLHKFMCTGNIFTSSFLEDWWVTESLRLDKTSMIIKSKN